MTFDGQHPQTRLTFNMWKVKLRKDCELKDKLLNFDNMGDYALGLLWSSGIDPTVDAICANVKQTT